ncbi:AAA family ATPase [Acinetobacter sp. SM34]|uniref:DEAD/DEAH box helicase n=1 Tax=Acinetobacter sp. SM34 TaxID=1301620 RepID=UPI001ED9DBD1|nr:AAA family ATPase [Acinetobacter sp. SM34]MCG2607865.1 AAA family ATPase [Acinetobacter sp. SM34]
MTNEYFFKQLNSTTVKSNNISDELAIFSQSYNKQIYLIQSPLGEASEGYNISNALIILSPKYKLMFINLGEDERIFQTYCDDFIEDLASISNKYKYKDVIGRPREWRSNLVTSIDLSTSEITQEVLIDIFESNYIELSADQRRLELIISLLTGSINNASKLNLDTPSTILDTVKQKILLFDGQQTRFIYEKLDQPVVRIQGLSGTGKTELLLHKLKELYISNEKNKIMFTCHNKILAASLRSRIPEFFDFMKVEQQIQWNDRLWCVNAWGSSSDVNSGAYRYICSHYNIPFHTFNRYSMSFSRACSFALANLEDTSETKNFAFDYMLIDESQDFPDSFFELCKKVTKKMVYIAGDIFQNIFSSEDPDTVPDFLLSKCYRTDPKTLMFAHGLGMGLFEERKLQWLSEPEWELCGYNVARKKDQLILSRDPLRRFEDLQNNNSIELVPCSDFYNEPTSRIEQTINLIKKIQEENPTVQPHDIAIIVTETDKSSYDLMADLELAINQMLGLRVNKAYDTRNDKPDELFLSTRNHVKGLEFPFVICHVSNISNSRTIRNGLYMILTRSFIKTYLLFSKSLNESLYPKLEIGLRNIDEEGVLKVTVPSDQEVELIKASIGSVKAKLSLDDQIIQMLKNLKVPPNLWDSIIEKVKAVVLKDDRYEYEFDSLDEMVKLFVSFENKLR